MREFVAGRRILIELTTRMTILDTQNVSFLYKAWEDNMGTKNLANNKGLLMKSRTKYIGIKYH